MTIGKLIQTERRRQQLSRESLLDILYRDYDYEMPMIRLRRIEDDECLLRLNDVQVILLALRIPNKNLWACDEFSQYISRYEQINHTTLDTNDYPL